MNDNDNDKLSSILPINQLTFHHFIDDSACFFVVAHPTSRCFHVLFVSRKQLQYAALDAHCLLQLALLGFTGTVDLESEGKNEHCSCGRRSYCTFPFMCVKIYMLYIDLYTYTLNICQTLSNYMPNTQYWYSAKHMYTLTTI